MKNIFFFLLLSFSFLGFSQSITVDTSLTPQQLIQDVLVGNCTQISNITSRGGEIGTDNITSFGYFTNGIGVLPFTDGIILTTGDINNAPGPNSNRQSSGWDSFNVTDNGWTGDADIAKFLGIPTTETHNATVLEFDFIPLTNKVSFDYFLTSEEYTQDFPCKFSDGFAFILSGPGIPNSNLYDIDGDPNTPDVPVDVGGKNIALIPGTNIPVSVTNIHKNITVGSGCNAKNEIYYDTNFSNNNATNFNGQTVKLKAEAVVQKGATYHIKLVVAEHTDGDYDTAVFLSANSFNTGINLGDDQILCEGDNVTLNADLGVHGATYKWFKDGIAINGQINTTLDILNGKPSDSGLYSIESTLPGGGGCIITDEVNITFNETPKPAIPLDWLVCDDDNNGFYSFDFTSKNTEILNGQNPNIFTVQYFSDATFTNEITTPYTNISAYTPQTIYVLVSNKNNLTCTVSTQFVINVFDSPKPALSTEIPDLNTCDDALDGDITNGFAVFDLTTQNNIILNGQSATEFDLTYYTDATLLNPIATPTAFTNTISKEQIIYVNVTNKLNPSCAVVTSFKILVNPVPIIATTDSFKLCDDNNDGFMSFDLTQKNADILNGQNPALFNFKYYTDAALTQEIATPYTNKNAYQPETIYVGVTSINNTLCAASTSFEIIVFESPNPALSTEIPDLVTCDDTLDGDDTNGSATFDLTTQSTFILNGQSSTDFDLTYFTDAALSNLIIDPTAFKNTTANEQVVYVNVSNKLNPTCTATTSFKVVVAPLPVINPIINLTQCDIDLDGITDFNLTESNAFINTQNPSPTFTYYLSLADAQSGDPTLAITNADAFSNSTASTIYTRVENSFGCFRVAQVNLLVSTTQANFLVHLEECDDTVEDGIVSFDFSDATTAILNLFPPGQNLSVSYYRTTADALAEQNEISDTSNYRNEVAYSQDIVVRVESIDNNACVGLGTHVKLTVNPLPQFDLLDSQFVCLNDLPLTVSVTNPAATYDYVWRNASGAVVGNNSPSVNLVKGGEYTVTARTTDGTSCSKTKRITLIESVTATVEDLTIVDDSDNNSIEVTILGTGVYEISLDNLNDFTPFIGNIYRFTNVIPGIHTIYIRDRNGCGLTIKQAVVIGFPRFLTPNGDGINDTWNVKGANLQPNSLIYIFDRFGKLVAKVDPTGPGWDGTFNGRRLPSSDYWFTARLEDGRIKKGHFSLVRR